MGMFEKVPAKEQRRSILSVHGYYRRDEKKVRIKAIFPEYVFLYTDMNMKEVYQMIRDVVLEVSLRAYADRIINVDKHNRRAFLEFEINGSRAHARRA